MCQHRSEVALAQEITLELYVDQMPLFSTDVLSLSTQFLSFPHQLDPELILE